MADVKPIEGSNMPLPSPDQLAARRAADDLRAGVPVIIIAEANDEALLFIASETLSKNTFDYFKTLNGCDPFVLLTKARAENLKITSKGNEAVLLTIPDDWSAKNIHALGDPTGDLNNPIRGPFEKASFSTRSLTESALSLAKEARLLPAGLGLALTKDEAIALQKTRNLTILEPEIIKAQRNQAKAQLAMVSHAKVPLDNAENTKVYMFRPHDGGAEHLAIIIGKLDTNEPILTRLHSECFTGDLLGSLKCDCGDQLKESIKLLNENGSGVLLYLAQEGRGIGLPAKLKAYALQDQGFDTVDANLKLGFDIDERLYDPAVAMLNYLSVKKVRLLTNNPLKVDGLKAKGVDVVERVTHHFPTNHHNEQYLETKKTRTGHLL